MLNGNMTWDWRGCWSRIKAEPITLQIFNIGGIQAQRTMNFCLCIPFFTFLSNGQVYSRAARDKKKDIFTPSNILLKLSKLPFLAARSTRKF
jgi:hypothetical protein